MPWRCSNCTAEVGDERSACPTCQAVKTAWTVAADRTRTIRIPTPGKLIARRGDLAVTLPPGHPGHARVQLARAELAPTLPRTLVRRIHARGHLPAARHVLIVDVPRGRGDGGLDVGVAFARAPLDVRALPPDLCEPTDDGGRRYVLLLVHGGGPSLDAVSFPGVTIVDVTEGGGFAPTIELSTGGRAPVALDTEPVTVALGPTMALAGGTFALEASFPSPAVAAALASLPGALGDGTRVGIFGHTDPSGSQAFNKRLADRRARAVLALVTSDLSFFDAVAEDEGWGPACYQSMLRGLGCNPGAIDGQPGAMTEGAVRAFRAAYNRGLWHRDGQTRAHPDLPEGGALDATTRAAIRDAYVAEFGARLPFEKVHGPASGPRCAGCGEFNLVADDPVANRRVTLVLWGGDAPAPDAFPCRHGDEDACALDGQDDRVRCGFYREHVQEEPYEPAVLAWDFEWARTPTGKLHLSALTWLPDTDDVTITVHRWTQGTPRELDSNEGEPLPPIGPELATLPGLVRAGVAYGLWTPPDGFQPFDLRGWFDEDGRWAPPVFVLRVGERWAVSSPPGWRMDRTTFDRPAPGRVLVLKSDGRLAIAPSADALERRPELRGGRIVALNTAPGGSRG